MKPETAKRLLDAHSAATELQQFIEGHTTTTFDRDRGLQLIVHKLLEIIGESLNEARRVEPISRAAFRTCNATSAFATVSFTATTRSTTVSCGRLRTVESRRSSMR